MTLRFAGVNLLLQDEDGQIKEWIERYFSTEELRDIAAEPVYNGAQTPKFLSKPNYRRSPGLQINRLYWPTGASRWSVGHFLLSTGQKDAIVQRLNWSAAQNTSLDHNSRERSGWLEFGESTTAIYDKVDANKEATGGFHSAQRLAVKMFMLPPRPITVRRQAEPTFEALPQSAEGEAPTPTTGVPYVRESYPDGLWIVPLVDARYYWQFFNVGKDWAAQVPVGTQTADQFIATIRSIADRLGVNIYHSDIHEEWGYIDPLFAKETVYHNAAYILDCLAYSTGRRLVHHWSDMGEIRRSPDGATGPLKQEWKHREFTLLTHDESFKRTTLNMHRLRSQISQQIPSGLGQLGEGMNEAGYRIQWQKGMVAGDDFSDKDKDYGGATIPQHVVVVFQKCVGGEAQNPPETYEKRYEAAHYTSVNTNKPGYVYWGSEKVIRTPAWAKWPSGSGSQNPTPDNETELELLGQRIATEYYKSLKLRHDYSLAGVELWTETGYDDSVVYDFAGTDSKGRYTALTRVRSREHNHGVEVICNQLGECGTVGHPGGSSPVSQECCGGCAPTGSVDNSYCVHCDDGSPNSWTFKLSDTTNDGIVQTPDGCCDVLAEAQFLFHDGNICGTAPCDCAWTGTALDVCNDDASVPDPAWGLTLSGLDPYDAKLCVTLPGYGAGGASAEICYSNPYPWCCNCKNQMRLECPDKLPVECTDIPCNICLEPGVACCPNPLPHRLRATLAGVNLCDCLNGEVVDLLWDSGAKKWVGQKAVCGPTAPPSNHPGPAHTIKIEFYCTAQDLTAGIGTCGNYELVVSWLDNCAATGTYGPDAGCTCDPNIVFQTLNAINCCNETTGSGGSYKVTITQ